jgi:hypothetical protein
MATLTVQTAAAGAALTFAAAAAGGDAVPQGVGHGGWHLPVVLVVRNAHTAAQTVTVEGLAAVSVPANTGLVVVPVVGGAYGTLHPVTYSGVTALTVAAARLTDPLE